MKKIKMIFMAAASLIGLVGSFAFSGPNLAGGWNDGTQYMKGTGHGQYTCIAPFVPVCTWADKAQTIPFDYGTFVLHP